MPWTKDGDFAKRIDSGGGPLIHSCYYTTHQPQTIKKITLCGYLNNSIMISASFIDKAQAFHFLQKVTTQQLPGDYLDVSFKEIIKICSENPEHFSTFLKLLIEEDAHVREVLIDICQSLNISDTLGLTLEDLKTKTPEEAITFAIEAQKNKSYDLIFELLDCYLNQIPLPLRPSPTFKNMYDLACAISIDNPHYPKAQDICVEILMRQEVKVYPQEQKEEDSSLVEVLSLEEDQPISQDDYFQNLELKFRHALTGTHPELTDMLYNELCGYGLGLPSTIKNIKGEADTLLSLAEVIRAAQPVLKKHATQTKAYRFFLAEEMFLPSPPNPPKVNMHIDLGTGTGMGMD